MNKLLFIIEKINGLTKKLSNTTEISYFKSNCETNVLYYAVLQTSIYKKGIGINLSLLLLETNLGQLDNWNDLLNTITEAQIDSYKINLPGYSLDGNLNSNRLKIMYPMNTKNMQISYTSIDTPDRRNIKEFKENLPDLVITNNDKKENDINFKNTIGSVNGYICYPYEFNNELFLKDGSKCLYSCNQDRQPDITLLDFSLLGNIEIIKFSDCTHKFNNRYNEPTANIDIEISLPKKYDLKNKSLFMVLANTLYYPDELHIINSNTIYLKQELTFVDSSIFLNHIAQRDFLIDTQIVDPEYSVADYFKKVMMDKEHFGAFFILVDTPDVSISRATAQKDVLDRTFITRTESSGLFINKMTHKLTASYRHEYSDRQVNYINKPLDSCKLDKSFFDKTVGIVELRCVHNKQLLVNYADSEYETIFITKG